MKMGITISNIKILQQKRTKEKQKSDLDIHHQDDITGKQKPLFIEYLEG